MAEFDLEQRTARAEEANINFEADSMINLSRSKITYICELCGFINGIDSTRCTNCGKPRPRSEYVNALKKLKVSFGAKENPEAFKKSLFASPAPVPVVFERKVEETAFEEEPVEEVVEVKEEIKEEVKQEASPYPYPYPPMSYPINFQINSGQQQSMIQPFIIVPYVNPSQPLYQYDPAKLYRYEPNAGTAGGTANLNPNKIYRFVPDSAPQAVANDFNEEMPLPISPLESFGEEQASFFETEAFSPAVTEEDFQVEEEAVAPKRGYYSEADGEPRKKKRKGGN
ncbi:MAG: hypothetical protein FWD49_02080 [Firmicutes bacterium]|nr:hypothetical protein [Bacillota bacterium]